MFVYKRIKVGDVVITRVKEKEYGHAMSAFAEKYINKVQTGGLEAGGGTRREIDIHRSRRQRLKNRLNVVSQKNFQTKGMSPSLQSCQVKKKVFKKEKKRERNTM